MIPERSAKGVGTITAPFTRRMRPCCWTTYRSLLPSGAEVTWIGDASPLTTGVSRTRNGGVVVAVGVSVRVAVDVRVEVVVGVRVTVAVAVRVAVAVPVRGTVAVGVAVKNVAGPPPTNVGHSPQPSTTTSGIVAAPLPLA